MQSTCITLSRTTNIDTNTKKFIDTNTKKFITTTTIQNLLNKLKEECEYKEVIVKDFYENEKLITYYENDIDSMFDIKTLHILADLHLYREDYFRVLADMEDNIRNMLYQIKKRALVKFSYNKAHFIIHYISARIPSLYLV